MMFLAGSNEAALLIIISNELSSPIVLCSQADSVQMFVMIPPGPDGLRFTRTRLRLGF